MKKLIYIVFLTAGISVNAQVAINTDNSNPDPSSMLDVKSIDKGVLLPRMTQAQREAIITPAVGLVVYQTDHTPGLYYNSGTSATPLWVIAGNGSGWGLTGNSGTNSGNNFIGTTDDASLAIKVNNQPAGKIDHLLFNTSWGYQSLTQNTTGINNTATGQTALYANTTGNNNTANGFEALFNNSSGYRNTAIGKSALYANTEGLRNTAIGYSALYSNTTGSSNIAIGNNALYSNTGGSSNVATGNAALYSNVTGYDNTANGQNALNSNTTGYSNTASGRSALDFNTTGYENTANGSFALYSNITGYYNTANGCFALYHNTGSGNTASGLQALYSNTGGYANTASGMQALFNNTAGLNNTAIGYGALLDNTTGNSNTATGVYAQTNNTTGDYNSAFGTAAFFNSGTLNNTTCIGYSSGGVVNASNRVEIGNASVSVIAGQVGFSTYSDARIKDNIQDDVPGLAFINQLRPVTYNLNIHRQNEMVYKGTKKDEEIWDSKYDIDKIKMTGFVAQEVEKAANESGYDFSGVQKPANPDELYSLRYSDFVMPLVKAVQELSHSNEELKALNAELVKRIEKLESK